MFAKAILLIVLGFLFLAGAIVSIIFTAISFANNKSGKYGWLSGVFVSIIGIVLCIFIFVRKAAEKVNNFTEDLTNQFESAMDTLSKNGEDNRSYLLNGNAQTDLLKSYARNLLVNNDQFYTYFGYLDYYRFPLRYPYSIHCTNTKEQGSLFNEKEVLVFNQSDNGEKDLQISGIRKLAFDRNFLLIEQQDEMPDPKDSLNKAKQYILFEFDTEQVMKAKKLPQLFDLARKKGYTGADSLVSIEQYNSLF